MTHTNPMREDIIDNMSKGITMDKILNSEIRQIRQFEVSTGYFDIEGWGLLRDSLEEAIQKREFSMRLLLGTETTLSSNESFEKKADKYSKQYRYMHSINQKLNEARLETDTGVNSISLMNFLKNKNVAVRLSTNRFNHSKCYIMGNNSVFIGSSNFTKGGLTGNYELNAGLYQPGVVKQTREWFERMWKNSEDTKQGLINVLKQSKFGIPPDPFEIYIKILFERYLPQISEVKKSGEVETGDLAQFQKEAVSIGLSIIKEYNGVMIADSTGLGKTNMGITILRHKISQERKRAMIVVPAQVKSMWKQKLEEGGVLVRKILSHTELAIYTREDIMEFRNYDFVLIDESQGFRSQHAKRRENLMTLLDTGKKKQIVLLSATPINNSLMDLYYQLLLITGEESNYFANSIGISNLYSHMRDAANTNKKIGLEKIQQLLDAVMIRRTRSYIRDVYPDDKINGKKIKFPKHSYSPIRYNLSEKYPDLFQNMSNGLTKLTMAPYGIEYYNKTLSEKERNKARITAHLQTIMLLKRFESSIEAGKISLENKINMYKYVLTGLKQKQKKILRVVDFNNIIKKWNSLDNGENYDDKKEADELETELIEQIKNIELVDGKNYELVSFEKDIKADLDVLNSMQHMVNKIDVDAKLNSVLKIITKDKALQKEKDMSGKILIFTEYAATAKYILQKLGGKRSMIKYNIDTKGGSGQSENGLLPANTEVGIITGSTSSEKRRKIIQAFAPKANIIEDRPFKEEEIDVLISTEILAEGQNLQDCNYVINYDLPWNPMRIVQRTGRIDRLTSEFDIVYSRACFPDKELDGLIKLTGKLAEKIHTVDSTIGDEGSILGIPMTPRVSNESVTELVTKLSKTEDHTKIIEDMQREMDMMPATSLMNLISSHVKKIGIEEMKMVAMGRRSGIKGEGQKVVLAYLEKMPHRYVHFVIYDYKLKKAEILDEAKAMSLIECKKNDNAHMPMDQEDDFQKSFEELIRIDPLARHVIRSKEKESLETKLRGDDEVGKRRKRVSIDLKNTLTKAFREGQISENDANRVLKLLEEPRVTRRYNELSRILLEYKKTHDSKCLVTEIINIADSLYLSDRDGVREQNQEEYIKPDLVLIGAMFVMSDKFDNNLDMGGLREIHE